MRPDITNIKDDFEAWCWEKDVESYARWKTFAAKTNSADIKAHCHEHMQSLQDKWPNHKLG